MKKAILCILLFSSILSSCGSGSGKVIGYACPMECEKDSIHAEPGSCSVCGMDLEPIEENNAK